MKVEILIPVYNEEAILADNAKLVADYCRHNFSDWQLTLIINGSSDNSLTIAQRLAEDCPQINIINLSQGGKGHALKHGLINSSAEVILFMDIDLAVALEDTRPLIALINQGHAVALGSRLLPDSRTDRSWTRGLSSKIYNRLANFILGAEISDWQCGFKAMNRVAAQTLAPLVQDDRWFFDTELLALANHFNLSISELPINWSENRYARRQSKIRLTRDPFIFLANLFKLRKRLKSVIASPK
jgi:glycosyltransferase involved in cell wall biosynthesis